MLLHKLLNISLNLILSISINSPISLESEGWQTKS